MTIKRREFKISYFTEVSAAVTVVATEGRVSMAATHPTDNVTIHDWFHFSGNYNGPDPLIIEGDDVNQVLAELGKALYPGAKHIISERDDTKDTIGQFLSDLYLAFVCGKWVPGAMGPKYAKQWEHSVGNRLAEEYLYR